MGNITVKGANYNYAPGLATYAEDGEQGAQGLNGNNIFYTNILINTELQLMAKQIKNNYYPLKNNTVLVNRLYQDNDIFFDNNGTIWQLIDYEGLCQAVNPDLYTLYFKIVGKITIDQSKYMDRVDSTGRIIIDPSNYSGFDIVMGGLDPSAVINKAMPFNIASNILDENDRIQFLAFQAIQTGIQSNGDLNLYFDINTKSFHVGGTNTLFIDSDMLIVDSSNDAEYDGYSRILTTTDSITNFKNLCDKLIYNVIQDTSGNNYIEISAKDSSLTNAQKADLLNTLVSKDDLYLKVYDSSVNQYVLYIDNEVKTYNTFNASLHVIPLEAKTNIRVGFNGDIANTSLIDYTYEPQSKQMQFRNSLIKYLYNIQDINSEIDFDMFHSIYDASMLNVGVGIYKEVPSSSTMMNVSRLLPMYVYTSEYGDNNKSMVFEFTARNYSSSTYLCMQANYNMAELSTDVCTVPLLPIGNLQEGKKYRLYYKPYYSSRRLKMHIDLLTDTLMDIQQVDPSNPVILTEIPGYVTDITKVGLLYNTEVFLKYKS